MPIAFADFTRMQNAFSSGWRQSKYGSAPPEQLRIICRTEKYHSAFTLFSSVYTVCLIQYIDSLSLS